MISHTIQKTIRKNNMSTLTKSLIIVLMVTGSCATVPRVTLQGHTISTLTGPKSTWDLQTLDRQIEYFTTSGRLARQMPGLMECATLRIDDLDFLSWPHLNASTRLQLQRTLGLGYYQRLEQMRRKCLQTRWYQLVSTTRSSSNQYRTGWSVPKPNSPTKYPPEDLPETPFEKPKWKEREWEKVWTRPSIGRIPGTTPMMGRNYNSSSMMSRGNGRGPTTSSTTGGSPKRASGSVQK